MLDALSLKMLIVQLHLLSMHLESRFASLRQVAFLMRAANKAFNLRGFGLHCPCFQVFWGVIPMVHQKSRGFLDSDLSECQFWPVSKMISKLQTFFKVTSCRKFESQRYPLVNVYITMENHHFSWENPL